MATYLGHPKSASPLYIGVRPILLPHGGKRKRNSVSATLSMAQGLAVVAGALMSLTRNMPLNRFITLHWGALGVSEPDSFKSTEVVIKRARDWLRDNGAPLAYVWVRETTPDSPTKGAHVHWLVHVPTRLRQRFLSRLRRWVLAAAGGVIYVKGAIQTRSVGLGDCDLRAPDSYRANLAAVLGYVLKGLTKNDTQKTAQAISAIWPWGVSDLPKFAAGGLVSGKRSGISRSLGKVKARN